MLHQRHRDPVDPDLYGPSYTVHDRLGNVRRVVVPEYDEQTQTWAVRAANSTTDTPFGQFYDGQWVETLANPWKFTGQWQDVEIDQYHLRARQYDPAMMRFTSRDPVTGNRQEPLTLHKYLYCLNNPVNMTDAHGRSPVIAMRLFSAAAVGAAVAGGVAYATGADRQAIGAAIVSG